MSDILLTVEDFLAEKACSNILIYHIIFLFRIFNYEFSNADLNKYLDGLGKFI